VLIVDSQVHIWHGGVPTGAHAGAPWRAEDVVRGMDEAGIARALNHPPPWDPEAMRIADAAARRYPDRLAYLGRFAPERAENRELVRDWRRYPGMLGFRFVFNSPAQASAFESGACDWLWREAEEAGAPIGVAAAGFLPALDVIAGRHPGLRLHIDHMGVPPGLVGAAAFAHLPVLLGLARRPNVAVKLSATPLFATDAYPFRSVHGFIRQVFDAFGPQRLFWGTDITRMPCPWRDCVTMFTEHMPWLRGHDLQSVMGAALLEWLDWKSPGA
jgi:predicted TIM-barrel fold metal-dependent hydrolase